MTISKSYSTTMPAALSSPFDAKCKALKISAAEGLRRAATAWTAPSSPPPATAPAAPVLAKITTT